MTALTLRRGAGVRVGAAMREEGRCGPARQQHSTRRRAARLMPRKSDPDYAVDADRGEGDVSTKRAAYLDRDVHQERAETRAGARELDAMIEASPGLTRAQKDRERAVPREANADLGHPVMQRALPLDDSVRVPPSARQRNARSAAKRAVQDQMPATQYEAMHAMITDDSTWRRTNDLLSENAGDAQELDPDTRRHVQRLDRAIQAYERGNDRGHLVYANVEMPTMINSSNLEGFIGNHFESDDVVEFDRYTGGAHSMHQVEATQNPHRTAVFEIQTRRGMYLGRSDKVDDTTHLLPRGVRFRIVGTHLARYRRPDGTEGRRHVIQLVDVDAPEGSSDEIPAAEAPRSTAPTGTDRSTTSRRRS